MVFGAGFLAKRMVRGTASMMGCSDETASTLGSIAMWGVALATLDAAGIVADSLIESGAETLVESGSTATDAGMETTSTARGYEDTGAAEEEVIVDEELYAVHEELYAKECPPLGPEDIIACNVAGEYEDEATDGSQELFEVLPYMAMAVAAYQPTTYDMLTTMQGAQSEDFVPEEFVVIRSQIIHNVINTTNLFGGVGKTDTEVHVSILQDETVVFAFRGTEPTEWSIGFADVLTDLAFNQEPVKLYDGSTQPVHTSPSYIKAHRGFQLGLKDVTDNQHPKHNLRLVLQALGMEAEDVTNVVCVGHSLGGALATLCAKWCRDVAFPDATIGCVTIGSPRVGNIAFAEDFNNRVVDGLNYRVVNKRDIVPCVPNLLTYPRLGSAYKHVGEPIYLLADEKGDISASLGGPRPTHFNYGFFHHSGSS